MRTVVWKHAAGTLNRSRKGKGGVSAHRKWNSRDFKTHVAEFGENVWYLKAASAGRGKLERHYQV